MHTQELDLRVGAAMTRFQSLYFQGMLTCMLCVLCVACGRIFQQYHYVYMNEQESTVT